MKFAMLYAAGMIGVEEGLLPWPDDSPMRAVRHCYENSLRQRDLEAAVVAAAVRKLARSLRSRGRISGVLVAERRQYPRWGDDQIGFHLKRGDKTETFLAKERLRLVCPRSVHRGASLRATARTESRRGGNYAWASEQMRVRSPSGEIVKVRLWRLDRSRLMALAGTTAAGSARAGGGNQRTPAPDAKRKSPAREIAGARRPPPLF